MIARLRAWWRAREMRILLERTRAAAASYMAYKSRYENALILEKISAEASDD